MKKFNAQKALAHLLLVGLITTAIFPGTAYAAEVGEQMKEANEQISDVISENNLAEQEQKDEETDVDGQTQEDASAEGIPETSDEAIEDAPVPASVTEHNSADEVLADGNRADEKSATRLIVTTDGSLADTYGAVAVDHYDNIYLLTYDSAETLENAYNAFVANAITVEKDACIESIKKDETPDDKVAKEVTNAKVTDAIDDDASTATRATESVEDHKTIVAVIDTGISDITNDDTLKDRVIEGTSTIGDSYVDDNGHGTAMAKIIAEDTAGENVYILPIKALDENGKGTVASVALAIKYAKEHGADVINLSLSGKGTSNILTNAISDCYNNGITVVTAAGNDNNDALSYMPGNIDTAINIAAADKDTDGNIIPATYTNHGETIDFAAIGTYKLTVVKDDIPLETELRGTSIASAHVSAYVALMKQINSTVDGVVNEVSESDVYASLVESANNFDGNIEPNYFGKGYLSKEGLIFKKSDKEDEKKDTDKEEKEADADQGMISSGGTWEVLCNNSGWGQFNAWWNNSSSCAQAVYDTVNTAYNYYRFDTLILHIQDACVFDTQIMVPAGKTLIIYGGNSIWTGDANKRIDWSKVGNGANSDGIKGTCIGAENNATLEVHNVNFYDWTTTTANFDEAPGCIGTYDDARNTYATLKADRCNFFSQNHWWSVSAGKAGSWVTNCYFNNASARSHGALCIVGGADVTDCTFDGKKGCSNSRALTIANNGGTTRITNCSIKNYGGWNPAVEADGTVIIQSCVINNGSNRVGDADIAISHSNGTLNMANSEICGAKVSGIKTASNSTVNISNCNIYSNAYGISNNGTINIRSDYDQSQYYNRYADLRNTFGNDDTKLWNHWINNGMSEGRVASNNCSTKIHNNSSYGIFNSGTVNMPGGSIYSNTYGARNYGSLNMSGGSIYSNTYDGIRNAGTCNLYGGSVKNNKFGIRNGYDDPNKRNKGTLNMSGGEISGSTMDGIYNYSGTATISGGTIKDNKRYGTNNEATMNYVGGASGGNAGYDIYQNGNYKMSGSASTYSNGVYLAKDRIIEITGPLTCADGAIKVTVNRTEAVVGRTIAQCLYGMNKDNADAMLNKFSLETKKTNTLGADGRSYRNAVLRSGTGTNGAVGNIILSEEYYVNFDGNVTNAHLTFALPQQQTVYWREDVNVPTVGTIVYYDGRELQSLQNIGYSKKADGSGGSCSVGQAMFYAADEITKDQMMYALYTSAADVNIDGNTQTAGDDYVIHGFVSNETALPQNTFEKVYRGTRYDENLEMDIPYKTEYSHHGWSYNKSAMYKDSDVGKCGDTFDLTAKILEMLAGGQESVSEEGYINNLTLYAVWDEPPKITAMNKYWNTDAIRAGKLNKEDLLRTASAKDKEDGTDVTLEVEDFDIEKFLHLGEYGWMSVRYKATDGAGNVSYKLIKVVVVQSGIVQGEFYDPNPAYVRMIDRENYNKKSHEEGGLMEDSVWYTIPTYKKTILDAFDRLDNGEAIVRYHFSCKDIREAQAYEAEAMENGTYPTAAHWEAWLKKFEHCKVFDTGYRSSKELNNSTYAGDYDDYVEPDE